MPAPRPVQSILETSRDTPLLELRRIGRGLEGRIFGKCEFLSGSQSHKDRTAFEVILDAEQRGALKPGQQVIEASTGSFGIALAQVCASRGHPLLIVMPESMSLERRETLNLYGAKFELTPAAEHIDGSLFRLDQLKKERRDAFFPSQFENERLVDLMAISLGAELIAEARSLGRVDVFVSTVGSSATLTGVGKALKAAYPQVKIIAAEPKESAVLQRHYAEPHRLHGAAARFVPSLYDPSLVTDVVSVSSADAWAMQKRLAKEEGVLVGPTSGANVHAAVELLKASPGAVVFTLLADTGERYFSVAETA